MSPSPPRQGSSSPAESLRFLLFLCTANSCRSILAEAAFNATPFPGWRAVSAGSHPAGIVHPHVLALLEKEGIPTKGLRSKSWDDPTLPRPNLVITLCDQAASEPCPLWIGKVPKAHWSTPDPTRAGGGAAADEAFARTWRILTGRLRALARLPLDNLLQTPDALLEELGQIAEIL